MKIDDSLRNNSIFYDDLPRSISNLTVANIGFLVTWAGACKTYIDTTTLQIKHCPILIHYNKQISFEL